MVTPLGNGALVGSAGIRRVEELDWWQEAKTPALPITLTPAQHFSARTPLDRDRALWGGFMLAAGQRAHLFRRGHRLRAVLPDVRQRLGPTDLALLPIGAYEPRWFMQAVHMNPAEAVQAHLDLGASESIGMHFGTFQLTTEGIDEPLRALEEACRARNIPLITIPDAWVRGIGAAEIGPSVDSEQEEGLVVIGLDTSSKSVELRDEVLHDGRGAACYERLNRGGGCPAPDVRMVRRSTSSTEKTGVAYIGVSHRYWSKVRGEDRAAEPREPERAGEAARERRV